MDLFFRMQIHGYALYLICAHIILTSFSTNADEFTEVNAGTGLRSSTDKYALKIHHSVFICDICCDISSCHPNLVAVSWL